VNSHPEDEESIDKLRQWEYTVYSLQNLVFIFFQPDRQDFMAESTVFAPIQQSTLADMVTTRIREAIITGQLKAGERLAEPALAAQLGVSRSPVREALHRLEAEGLVYSQTNHGCYVWEPTEKDVDEILSMRVSIESLAAEWAIHELTEDDFAEMEAYIAIQRKLIEAENFVELIHEDKRFHEYICLKADHSRLMVSWQYIMGQWEVLMYRRMSHNPTAVVPTVLTDHRDLMNALRQRDLEAVIRLHRAVNERVGRQVKEALRAQASHT
jgi:DNA-binding GntR family transcriptional regulator